ncbi:MAG: hypothetical protein H6638_11945 [Ardenticatenales bacterium]|nr:hypothetical protein [Ardenticatenales bacterium]
MTEGSTGTAAPRGRARRPRAVGHGGPARSVMAATVGHGGLRSGTAARGRARRPHGRARRPDPTGTHKQCPPCRDDPPWSSLPRIYGDYHTMDGSGTAAHGRARRPTVGHGGPTLR